jgi:hypothetical protein
MAGSEPITIPRFFIALSKPRRLLALAVASLLFGAAMQPAVRTMADHGGLVVAFQDTSSVEKSSEILESWGPAGRRAAWWQLGLDIPFMFAYGLFTAGACAAVARRAEASGKRRLRQAAAVLAWCGPLAIGLDLAQDISLAFMLFGHIVQPWPAVSAISTQTVWIVEVGALAFALVGWFATRDAPPLRPRASA